MTTISIGGAEHPLDLSLLDFATREELVEVYIEKQGHPRLHQYVLAAVLALSCPTLKLTGLPDHAIDPVPYGRAAYSQMRSMGADRVAIIKAGNAAILQVTTELWPRDPEVAERQDFSTAQPVPST